MALPDPKPGLVVRYDYLWAHEAAAGRDHSKTCPACLIAATHSAIRPRYVVLLPITQYTVGRRAAPRPLLHLGTSSIAVSYLPGDLLDPRLEHAAGELEIPERLVPAWVGQIP